MLIYVQAVLVPRWQGHPQLHSGGMEAKAAAAGPQEE